MPKGEPVRRSLPVSSAGSSREGASGCAAFLRFEEKQRRLGPAEEGPTRKCRCCLERTRAWVGTGGGTLGEERTPGQEGASRALAVASGSGFQLVSAQSCVDYPCSRLLSWLLVAFSDAIVGEGHCAFEAKPYDLKFRARRRQAARSCLSRQPPRVYLHSLSPLALRHDQQPMLHHQRCD